MPVHATMEEVNRQVAPGTARSDGFSAIDGVVIVIGIAITILGLYLTREAKLFLQQMVDQL